MQESDFVANAEATSVDGSQECDILPEPVYRELSDDTKVNLVFIARNSTCLCVMTNFGSGPLRRGPFNRAVANRIIGHTLSDLEWRQAKLPANRSGLALSDVLIIADAALVSSHAASAKILIQSESPTDAILLQRLQKAPALKSAVTKLNAIYMAMGNGTPVIPSTSDLLNCMKQKELAAIAWKSEFKLVLKAAGDKCSRHKAWIRSCAQFGASQWIYPIPTVRCFTAPGHIYKTMLKMQLHIDQVSGDQLRTIARCDCGEINIENLHTNTGFRKGTHWRHQCNKRIFYRTGSHNEARDNVYQACKIANMDAYHEPPGLYKEVGKRPAGLLIYGISADFDRTAIDFSITEVESNTALAAGSTELPLVAALMAEQAKIKDHEKQLADHGFATYEFDKLPFIIETSGAWSVKIVALWKRIKSSHKAAVADGLAYATFLNTKQAHTWSAVTLGSWFPQRVSFSIRKWMASVVHAGINSAMLKD